MKVHRNVREARPDHFGQRQLTILNACGPRSRWYRRPFQPMRPVLMWPLHESCRHMQALTYLAMELAE